MAISVTFREDAAFFRFDFPLPPEKDEIKAIGAHFLPDTKEWRLALQPPAVQWLADHDIVIPEGVTLPEPESLGLPDQSVEQMIEESKALDSDMPIPAPDGLSYFGFQRAGIAFASKRTGTLIGDDMGLGKTIQGIGLLNVVGDKDPDFRSALIVCPLSVSLNWHKELEKWLVRNDLTVGRMRSSKALPDTDIVIASWSVLAGATELLRSRKWDAIILDEAHYAKNPKAKRTVAVFGGILKTRGTPNEDGYTPTTATKLPPLEARYRVALTGTPIPNRPVEMWPVLHWLNPVLFPKFFDYALRYCGATNNGYGWDFSGASNLAELQDTLRTVMVRRLKTDVLDLPAKMRQIILLDPDASPELARVLRQEREVQQKTADAVLNAQVAVELAKASESEEDYKQAVAQLHEANSYGFQEMARARYELAVAKIPHVAQHVQDALEGNNRKIVVFTYHRDVLTQLRQVLETPTNSWEGVQVASIMGGDAVEDRQAAVDRFQSDPNTRIFLATIGAAREGITLTEADTAIFAELDWSPGRISQAEDRIYRIGQTKKVLIQPILVDGSMDAVLALSNLAKTNVIDATLDASHELTDVELPDLGPTTIVRDPNAPKAEFRMDADNRWVADTGTSETSSHSTGCTQDVPRTEFQRLAAYITPEEIADVHMGVRELAERDRDFASSINSSGFSKIDVSLGHSLAERDELTPAQAVLAARLCNKYRRQIGVGYQDLWLSLKERGDHAEEAGETSTQSATQSRGLTVG